MAWRPWGDGSGGKSESSVLLDGNGLVGSQLMVGTREGELGEHKAVQIFGSDQTRLWINGSVWTKAKAFFYLSFLLSNVRSNLIYHSVRLSKDMPNRYKWQTDERMSRYHEKIDGPLTDSYCLKSK